MANCRQCGAKLPSFTFGDTSPYCKTCQAQLAPEEQPQKVDTLPGQSSFATNPTPATFALLGINIAVFIVMVASGMSLIDPDTQKVLHWGADYGPYTLGGQYWRLITSMFIHFGIIHIFGNMWCLWSLGRLAEKLLGSFSVTCTYLLTGVGASLLSLSWDPMRVSAGASGAIFGIAGVLITTLYYGKHNLPQPAVRRLLGYVVRFSLLNLLFGLKGHIDNAAHAGGLVTGLLIGFFLARTFASAEEERGSQRRTIFAVSALALLVLFVPVAKAKAYAVEFGKGKNAFEQRDYQAAIEHMQKYTTAQPDNDYGHALLGASFQALGRFDDAMREYERGLAINPDYHYIQVALGEIYTWQHHPEKAVRLFRQGINKMPDDAKVMYYYGSALAQTRDWADAETALRKSIALDGKSIESHQLLSEVLKNQGKSAEARKEQHLGRSVGGEFIPQP
ncbi:MAG TPA: rhomboid family intramembrane serine protease [Candidatus Angelobacter sp.]|nr:rhomboid family intramembrane serine protease [Candidatus Angelobacter sp.]